MSDFQKRIEKLSEEFLKELKEKPELGTEHLSVTTIIRRHFGWNDHFESDSYGQAMMQEYKEKWKVVK